jgi:hypothetical protein
MALPAKVWAYDWNQDAGSGYAYQNHRPYHQPYNGGFVQPYYQPFYDYNPLVYARASAQAQYDAAVARGDSRGAKHLGNAIRKLDRQLAARNAYSYPYNSYNASSSPYSNNSPYSSYNSSYGNGYGVDMSSAATMTLPLVQQFMSH